MVFIGINQGESQIRSSAWIRKPFTPVWSSRTKPPFWKLTTQRPIQIGTWRKSPLSNLGRKATAFNRRKRTQCGNFIIFLSLRFYVKSILENLEIVKLATIFVILWALNFAKLVYFSFQKVQEFIKIKLQSLPMCKNGRFCTSRFLKIDFT